MERIIDTLHEATALILVGGLGTRLSSVVRDRPKGLAEVQGRPFLGYLLDQLKQGGFRHVVFCTGHLGKQISTQFGSSYGPLHLSYSYETTPRGTAGALRLALSLVTSDTVLVMNGDSYCQIDLSRFWTWHADMQADASLVLTHVSDTERFGRVEIGPQARIIDFGEKDGRRGPGWINAGIYLLSRRLIASIPQDQFVSLERDVIPRWIGRGLFGYQQNGAFLDIGTPESYSLAAEFFTEEMTR